MILILFLFTLQFLVKNVKGNPTSPLKKKKSQKTVFIPKAPGNLIRLKSNSEVCIQ